MDSFGGGLVLTIEPEHIKVRDHLWLYNFTHPVLQQILVTQFDIFEKGIVILRLASST